MVAGQPIEPAQGKKPARRTTRWLWLYALVLTVTVAYFVLPQTVGSHLRSHLLTVFQKHWSQHDVRLGSVRFEPEVGIILDDLRIWPKQARWNDPPIVRIDRLICRTKVQWEHWDRTFLASDEIIVEGLQCEAHPTADGRWSLLDLWPPPTVGEGAPLITLRNGRIKCFQEADSSNVSLEIRDIQAEMRKVPSGMRFSLSLSTDASGRITVKGSHDTSGATQLIAQVEQLRLDPALIRRLPARYAASAKCLDGFAGTVDLAVRAERQAGMDWQGAATVALADGRYSSSRLPYPAEEIRGRLTVWPNRVDIADLTAKMGASQIQVAGSVFGLTPESPMDLQLQARSVDVTPVLLGKLPEKLRLGLEQIKPRGLADIDMRMLRTDRWRTSGTAVLRGMEVEPAKFPYPIRSVNGVVHWANNIVQGKALRGLIAGQTATADVSVSLDRNGPMDITATLSGPTPIDETLLKSLTPRGQPISTRERVVRSLEPQGSLQLQHARIRRDQEGRLSHAIKLQVLGGQVHYQGFPYPIYDVQGTIEIDEHGVRFHEFRGQNNDAATIQLTGSWTQAVGPTGGRLDLKVDGYSVPLDDSLRSALPVRVRQTWDSLGPSGTLDHLHVQLSADEGQAPQYAITAQQWGSEAPAARIVSMEPVALPYRLDIRRAVVRMNGDAVLIEQLDGWHGSSHLTTTGHCTRNATGQWVMHLDVLPGSRIHGDDDLLSALPSGTRASLDAINLQGPLGVRGTADLVLPTDENSTPEMYWDVLLQLEGNQLGDNSEVTGVRGEVTFGGTRQGSSLYARGQLRIDSMHVLGVQVTQARGPFELRDGKVSWGRTIANNNRTVENLEPVSANVCGGQVTTDGSLSLDDSRYAFSATLADADVPTLLADIGESHSSVRGRCGLTLNNIEGIIGQNRALSGNGSAYLRDANVYQLPPIVMLLGVLAIDPREDAAFTTGDTKFHIDGDQVVFDSIQIWGNVLALYGGGTINARRDVQLVFDTHVSPQNIWSQVMRPISGQRYNLWSIQVGGTIDDPQIKRLPQVEKALDRLLPESQVRR